MVSDNCIKLYKQKYILVVYLDLHNWREYTTDHFEIVCI